MSISDRLDEIEARTVRAREGRITDRYRLLDVDAPAMLAALRSVLDLAEQMESERNPEIVHSTVNGEEVFRCTDHTLGAERRRWAKKIRRAVEAALGEGS